MTISLKRMHPPVLFTSREWLEKAEYVHLLWPVWGASHWHDRYHDIFDALMAYGKDLFVLTDDAASADFFLPPCGWQEGGSFQALRMAELAARHGRPLIAFFNSDSDEPIPLHNAMIFRTSMSASSSRPNEQAWPAWTCDVLRTYGGGRFEPRAKPQRPTVGYCGYVDYRNAFERVQRTIRGQLAPWSRLRGEAVRALSATQEIDCRFVLRRRFGGNARAAEREEYARNLLACDYALVARGRGGPSARRKCPTPHGLPRLATTQTRTRRGQPTGRRRARPRRRSLAEMRCARKQRRTCAQRTGSRPLAPPPQLDATVKVCRACQNGAQRLYHIGRLGRVAVEAASGASALRCVASSTAAKAALRRAAPPASRRTRRSA